MSRRPSSRAGPARVMIAISSSVYSRSRSSSSTVRWIARLVRPAQLLVAELAVHQQADQPRVAEERAAVRVVGREHEPPRVAAQQEQLEPDAPLQRVHVVLLAVGERHDPAAGLDLGVGVHPLAAGDVAQHARTPARRRSSSWRRPEHHLADVGAELGMRAEVLGELRRARARPPAGPAAVGVELEVREVGAAALQRAQRVERRVASCPATPRLLQWTWTGCGSPSSCTAAGDRVDHLPRRDARRRRRRAR